ncbi:MAG TPA: MgtC/SapB family protein [Pyrinomonadaceae bacterium]|jgi:putative Mg2+ transporter-C (MgtC) family protein|nr:MgtC/SapB family protein [Pyrinomonadaceae bacterium]
METLYHELTLGLHDRQQIARIVIRLLAAFILGGLVGVQRQRTHKPAGLRTHMLVCVGTAVFVTTVGAVGMAFDGQSRVIQGIITGLGFIGGGSILKLTQDHEIKGLTTAAGLWMTAAIGVTVGLGALGIAIITTILTLIILVIAMKVEKFVLHQRDPRSRGGPSEDHD